MSKRTRTKQGAGQVKGKRNPTPNPTPKKGRKPAAAPDWRPVFLKELAATCNVSESARKAGVDRTTAYAARAHDDKDDPQARADALAFARQWDNAIEIGIDALEAEARRRAMHGVLEPAGWYKGKAGGKVRRYSDTLMIVLLKGHRPEKYRENIHTEHAGSVAVITSDEMARARDDVAKWEKQTFGSNGNGQHEPVG